MCSVNMSKDVQISIIHKVDIAVIGITGDVTATSNKAIADAYNSDKVLDSPKILLKFDNDCYINSDGLVAIIDIAVEGYKRGQRINACGLSDHFQKIFHMVGLTRFIHVFSSQEDAIYDFSKNLRVEPLQ